MTFVLGMFVGEGDSKPSSSDSEASIFILGLLVPTFPLCFFRRPLGVAGNGSRYFCTIFGEFKHGIPCIWLVFAALVMVWIGGLEKD